MSLFVCDSYWVSFDLDLDLDRGRDIVTRVSQVTCQCHHTVHNEHNWRRIVVHATRWFLGASVKPGVRRQQPVKLEVTATSARGSGRLTDRDAAAAVTGNHHSAPTSVIIALLPRDPRCSRRRRQGAVQRHSRLNQWRHVRLWWRHIFRCKQPTHTSARDLTGLSLSLSPFLPIIFQVDRYQSVSSLDFIGAKDDGCGCDNWSYKTCKAPVKSSPPIKKPTPNFVQAGCPSCRRTNSVKALNGACDGYL